MPRCTRAEEGPSGGCGEAGDLRDRRVGGGGVGRFGGEPDGEHVVRGASQRYGPEPERAKVRKTYCFSKDWWVHRAVTFFTMYSYNFCWPVRTLKTKAGEDRTPAMMAKLTDHVWTLVEWLKRPAVQLA